MDLGLYRQYQAGINIVFFSYNIQTSTECGPIYKCSVIL